MKCNLGDALLAQLVVHLDHEDLFEVIAIPIQPMAYSVKPVEGETWSSLQSPSILREQIRQDPSVIPSRCRNNIGTVHPVFSGVDAHSSDRLPSWSKG